MQAQSVTQYKLSEADYQTYNLHSLLNFLTEVMSSPIWDDRRALIEALSDLVPRTGQLVTKWLEGLDESILPPSIDIREMNPRLVMQSWLKGWIKSRRSIPDEVLRVCNHAHIMGELQRIERPTNVSDVEEDGCRDGYALF